MSLRSRPALKRGATVPYANIAGAVSLASPSYTPFGSGTLQTALSAGGTIGSVVLKSSPFGCPTPTGASPTLLTQAVLTNTANGQTQSVNVTVVSNGSPTNSNVTLTCAGQSGATTWAHAFPTATTTVALVPAETNSCARYNVAIGGLPTLQFDMSVANPNTPASCPAVVLAAAAEVYPFAQFQAYDAENASPTPVYITEALVSSVYNYLVLNAVFAGNNAWNANTGHAAGSIVGQSRLVARWAAIVDYVYKTYCLSSGAGFPSGATSPLPLIFWGGSGAAGVGMILSLYYGLADGYGATAANSTAADMIMLDAYGANTTVYRQMSGLAADIGYNPAFGGLNQSALPETLLADQVAGYGGGNWDVTNNNLPLVYGDGRGPAYTSIFSSYWGPTPIGPGGVNPSAPVTAVSATPLTAGAGQTISSSLTTLTCTAAPGSNHWPNPGGARDVFGTGTVSVNGQTGTARFTYFATSGNTFTGVSWAPGDTGSTIDTNAGDVKPVNTILGYAGAAAYMSEQNDGPYAKPAQVLSLPNTPSGKRYLRFIAGSNDESVLQVGFQNWLPSTSLSPANYLWVVVPGGAHDVSQTTIGAKILQASLTNQPVIIQSAALGGTSLDTTPPPMPGWTINGYNPQNILVNEKTLLYYIVWDSDASVALTPPAGWFSIPAGLSAASYGAIPISTFGKISCWGKVSTGSESLTNFTFTPNSGKHLYCAISGEIGIGLDNMVNNTSVNVLNGASNGAGTASGVAAYGIDVCGAAVVNSTTATVGNNTSQGNSVNEVAIAFYAGTIASGLTGVPGNNYGQSAIGAPSITTTAGYSPDGTHTGGLAISQKALVKGNTNTANFTVTASGTQHIAVGYFICKGSLLR